MSSSKPKLNDQSLLLAVEKMLGAGKKGKEYCKTHSLLGFCARLIAIKPQARQEFRRKLRTRLVQDYLQNEKTDQRQKIADQLTAFRILVLRRANLKLLPVLLSLILLLSLSLSKSLFDFYPPQNSLANRDANPHNIQLAGVAESLSSSWKEQEIHRSAYNYNLAQINELKKQGDYRVLKERNGFRLIEYSLIDGSRIIMVESILF